MVCINTEEYIKGTQALASLVSVVTLPSFGSCSLEAGISDFKYLAAFAAV